jgi:sugar/nucleoside kinase (ribokinase family)
MLDSTLTEYDIVVYGTVCLDVIWRVPHLPPLGTYIDIQAERRTVGGEASNTAIALARWGAKVALLGNTLGNDEDNDTLRALFAQETPEIETRFLQSHPSAQTPFCLCIATPDGHRTMIGKGFSEMQCPPLSPTSLASHQLFTTDPNAWEAGAQACMMAAEADAAVVPMDYTRHEEVSALATINLTSSAHVGADLPLTELAAYAQNLRDKHGKTVIVTCGEKGCLIAEDSGAKPLHIPAYRLSEVVDSTGAGDVFRAGILYGLWKKWDIERTARFASAAAALNCTALGGWGGVKSEAEITTFQQETPRHSQAF